MSDTVTLYHGTDEASAASILKDGFKVGGYLTNSVEVAEYFAQERCYEVNVDCSNTVILKITVSLGYIRVDYAAYEEPLTFYRGNWAESEDEWHELCDSGGIPYPDNELDVNVALEVTGCVRTIEHITNKNCVIWE